MIAGIIKMMIIIDHLCHYISNLIVIRYHRVLSLRQLHLRQLQLRPIAVTADMESRSHTDVQNYRQCCTQVVVACLLLKLSLYL